MPAVGQDSGTTYYENQINNPDVLARMKVEVLSNVGEPGSIVVPVRRADAPHFRRLAGGAFRVRVGTSEQDETHKRCISHLHAKLTGQLVGVVTNVFEGGSVDTYILVKPTRDSSYIWYEEARIPLGGGRYIQSDLCGRDVTAFSMGTANPGIIIEVIQTHLPERDTFYALLNISKAHVFVGFYFIGPGRMVSKFNSVLGSDEAMHLRFAYYLLDGVFYENGQPVRRDDKVDDETWYQQLLAKPFAYAMAHKSDKPKPK